MVVASLLVVLVALRQVSTVEQQRAEQPERLSEAFVVVVTAAPAEAEEFAAEERIVVVPRAEPFPASWAFVLVDNRDNLAQTADNLADTPAFAWASASVVAQVLPRPQVPPSPLY